MKTPRKGPYLAYMAPMGKANLLSVFCGEPSQRRPMLQLTRTDWMQSAWPEHQLRSKVDQECVSTQQPLAVDSSNQMAFSCFHSHNCFTSCKIDPGQHFTKTMEPPPTMAESSMDREITVLGYSASRRASRQSLYHAW